MNRHFKSQIQRSRSSESLALVQTLYSTNENGNNTHARRSHIKTINNATPFRWYHWNEKHFPSTGAKGYAKLNSNLYATMPETFGKSLRSGRRRRRRRRRWWHWGYGFCPFLSAFCRFRLCFWPPSKPAYRCGLLRLWSLLLFAYTDVRNKP